MRPEAGLGNFYWLACVLIGTGRYGGERHCAVAEHRKASSSHGSSMGDWDKADAENSARLMANLEDSKKYSAAHRDFFTAAQQARFSVTDDWLLPRRDENGDLRYTDEQGNKAACLAREDVVAIATVQLAILSRLDRNRNYMVIAIVILIYIATRL